MATAKHRDELEPMARVLTDAMDRAGMDVQAVARAVNMSVTTVHNWRMARGGISPAMAAKLGNLLQVDPATLRAPWKRGEHGGKASQAKKRATGRTPGRPPGRKNSKPRRVGPAQRAVALHAARDAHVQVIPPAQPRPSPGNGYDKDPGVFGMRVDEDGTMHLWLRTKLPFKKGSTLLRTLLDFGLVTEPAETSYASPGTDGEARREMEETNHGGTTARNV